MVGDGKKTQRSVTNQDLYPNYSPKEQQEAEAMWKSYVALVWKIYNRIKDEDGIEDLGKEHLKRKWESVTRLNKVIHHN